MSHEETRDTLHFRRDQCKRASPWAGARDERGVREASMQDGNPNGYYIISFDGNEYRTRLKSASQGAEKQMRIVLDPPLISPTRRLWSCPPADRDRSPGWRRPRISGRWNCPER
ncbi:MAG: calcineurin-like phosphoesterase C-terminal domain-containing protein [Gammaproteobacteria bacterium]|nr:calcineurin-like phosphoesterase C-terminal domain-containing protein [Gammaproteobacteria bacterium]MBA3731541.1 calcineurin-like phosphoesterase C-terminal domain-containing protein [Gammaproteobacteria bacterium]